MWAAAEAVLRGKFSALNAMMKNENINSMHSTKKAFEKLIVIRAVTK